MMAAKEMRIRTSVELRGPMVEIITRFMLRYVLWSTLRMEDIIVCGIIRGEDSAVLVSARASGRCHFRRRDPCSRVSADSEKEALASTP